MTHFKKWLATAVACLLAAIPLSACKNAGGGENEAPQILGVQNVTVVQDEAIDVLSGVTATDKEDGDLTDRIEVECDSTTVTITNGMLVAAATGDYTLTYTVTDSVGAIATEYADLTVTAAVAEATDYLQFDFAAAAETEVDLHDWKAAIVEDAEGTVVTKSVGGVRFDVTNCGQSDGQVTLSLDGVALKKDAAYQFKVYMKSDVTAYCHIIAIDGDAAEWKTFGGVYNERITTKMSAHEMSFTADHNTTKAKLTINLGKIEDGRKVQPEAYSVLIEKVELQETTGSQNLVEYAANSFDTADDVAKIGLNFSGHAAGAAAADNGAAKVSITNSGDEGIWNARFHIPVGQIEKGKKYRYTYEITANQAWSVESLVESAKNFEKSRANWSSFNLTANEKKTVSTEFVADATVTDGCVRLQVGKKGNAAVDFIIDNFVLYEDRGTKQTSTALTRFSAFGWDSANANDKAMPFDTFNGTDEQNEKGIGAIWCENESLFYRIDEVGTADWHNKLIFGFRKAAQGTDNPVLLEPSAYYTVRFRVRADQNIGNIVFELAELGNWDNGRILNEIMEIGTEWSEVEFTTTKSLAIDTAFEMVMKFGSGEYDDASAGALIEITEMKITKQAVVG